MPMSHNKLLRLSTSEARLTRLIEQRLAPDADKDAVDESIWNVFGEEWAIMFTDLSGFSRGVEKFGIIHFLQTIFESERLLIPIIEDNDGILIKAEGDSFLVIFRRCACAVQAAVEMQRVLAGYNVDKEAEEKVLLCLGIGFGKILKIGDADVFGQQVNATSKLGEDTAKSGDILLTSPGKQQYEAEVAAGAKDAGVTFKELEAGPLKGANAWRAEYEVSDPAPAS